MGAILEHEDLRFCLSRVLSEIPDASLRHVFSALVHHAGKATGGAQVRDIFEAALAEHCEPPHLVFQDNAVIEDPPCGVEAGSCPKLAVGIDPDYVSGHPLPEKSYEALEAHREQLDDVLEVLGSWILNSHALAKDLPSRLLQLREELDLCAFLEEHNGLLDDFAPPVVCNEFTDALRQLSDQVPAERLPEACRALARFIERDADNPGGVNWNIVVSEAIAYTK